jgi:tetratricopeptide (TPR) repeat protein
MQRFTQLEGRNFRFYILFIFLLTLILRNGEAFAQEDELPISVTEALQQNAQTEEEAQGTELTQEALPLVAELGEEGTFGGYNDAISEKWNSLLRSAKSNDLHSVHKIVDELVELRNEFNYESLDDYSLVLLQLAKARLSTKDIDGAAFYVETALNLSPTSPFVALQSIPTIMTTRTAPLGELVVRILKSIWYYPELSLQMLKLLIYPLLWAATFALFLSFGLQFGVATPELLSSMSDYLPRMVRGVLGPVILLVALFFPILLGPLWTLALWSLCAVFLMHRRTFLPLCASIVVMCWATLLPFRENIETWLKDEGIKGMLRITSGSFRNDDIRRVQNLRDRRALDPVVSYSYGQVLLRDGMYQEAEEAFLHSERIISNQPWTVAERGLLAYLRGDLKKAKTLHVEAEQKGLSTPGFLFNYSKVAFGLLETDLARDLFERARKKNPELIRNLLQRESILGNKAVAEIQLPGHIVMDYSWFVDPAAEFEAERKMRVLMGFINPEHILPFSTALLCISIFAIMRHKKKGLHRPYKQVNPSRLLLFFGQILPGGTLVISGREVVGILILGCFLFLSFPIIGWPGESVVPFEWAPALKTVYAGTMSLLWVIFCLIGMVFSVEEEAVNE